MFLPFLFPSLSSLYHSLPHSLFHLLPLSRTLSFFNSPSFFVIPSLSYTLPLPFHRYISSFFCTFPSVFILPLSLTVSLCPYLSPLYLSLLLYPLFISFSLRLSPYPHCLLLSFSLSPSFSHPTPLFLCTPNLNFLPYPPLNYVCAYRKKYRLKFLIILCMFHKFQSL